MIDREKAAYFADMCIIILTVLVLIWAFFAGVISVLLPFLIAYVIALLIRRPVEYVHERTRIPKGAVAAVLVVIIITALCLGIWAGVTRLLYEAGELLSKLGDGEDSAIGNVSSFLNGITEKIPVLRPLREKEELVDVFTGIDGFVRDAVNNFLERLSTDLGTFVAAILKGFPETMLYIFVTVIASVYLCVRIENLHAAIGALLPVKVSERISSMRRHAADTLKKYFKAYSLIYLITFGELFFGLTLLKVPYSLVLSLLIALVDILPVFGVGTVLIPWAATSLLLGNNTTFTALLVLYAVITLVRQLAEPRIVGKSIGLDPLFTLFAMFVGFRIFGVIGMFLTPFLAVIVVGALRQSVGDKRKEENS